MRKIVGFCVLALVGLMLAAPSAGAEDVLGKIKSTGKLVVGVKVDYKPFGFRNEKGEMVGLEHDLVADIATRLQAKLGRPVEVEKVAVTAQNRIQFLQQGKVDLMIATMNDTPERRKLVDIIDPDYYSSGVNLLTRKSNHFTKWEDLKGKTVCTLQGAWYNKEFTEKYQFEAAPYAGVAEAAQATLDNRCVGFLDDDANAASLLQDGERWGDFELPLQTQADSPWGVSIRPGDPAFKAFLSETITDWHRKGTIAALEKKWGIAPTRWVAEMHAKTK